MRRIEQMLLNYEELRSTDFGPRKAVIKSEAAPLARNTLIVLIPVVREIFQ